MKQTKPHLCKMGELPLWKCIFNGRSALGDTPLEAYKELARRAKFSAPSPYQAPLLKLTND